MITIDISADLNAEDETGLVWTLLDEAMDPDTIRPGAIVVAGSSLTPAVCEVVDLIEKPAGAVVHLRVFRGFGAHRRPVVSVKAEPRSSQRPAGRATSTRATLEDLIRRSGSRPVGSIEDLDRFRADLWESDEELNAFLADASSQRSGSVRPPVGC